MSDDRSGAPGLHEPAPSGGRDHTLSEVLRAVVVVGIGLALLAGAARVQSVRSGAHVLHGDVVTLADTDLLVRRSTAPPDARGLDALSGMTASAPLLAAQPAAPRLTAGVSPQLMAGRAAGLTFSVAAEPGMTEQVRLLDGRGAVLDSVVLTFDDRGIEYGAFRVRPAREGWHEWSVSAAGESRVAGAWVLPERVPRVLIAAGPPTPETRFVARALEEAGVEIELRQPLGHDLTAGAVAAALPVAATELASYDVVIVLHGAPLDQARRAALDRFVMQGGGLLIATRDALLHTLGIAAGVQPAAGTVASHDMTWSLPPELLRLPAMADAPESVSTAVEPLAASDGAYTAATTVEGDALLVLRAVGAGRAAGLGLRESWRWRVAGGRSDEHREFWRALVDWLAPPPDAPRVDTPQPIVPTGLPVLLDVEALAAPVPAAAPAPAAAVAPPPAAAALTPVQLRRPDGSIEPLTSGHDVTQRARLLFVPVDTGVHVLLHDDREIAAVRASADAGPASAQATALLTLTADASGGRVLPDSAIDTAVRARDAALPPSLPWRPALLLVLLALALADWALRRVRGAP